MSRTYAVKRSGNDELWCQVDKGKTVYYTDWVEADEVLQWSDEAEGFSKVRGFDGEPQVHHTFHRRYFDGNREAAIRAFLRWHERRMPHE